MEELKHQLRQYVADHPPNYSDSDCHSILDMLYYRYSECNQPDNIEIKAAFTDLYQKMHGMSLREMDRIIDVVCTLCPATAYSGHISIKREEAMELNANKIPLLLVVTFIRNFQ